MQKNGKEAEITEKLLYAYFTESKHIGDHETLADIAEAAGLDRQEALNVLQDKNAYANDVRIDEAIAQQYGIRGVPYFVINQKYAISGAQPMETFVNALQKYGKRNHLHQNSRIFQQKQQKMLAVLMEIV